MYASRNDSIVDCENPDEVGSAVPVEWAVCRKISILAGTSEHSGTKKLALHPLAEQDRSYADYMDGLDGVLICLHPPHSALTLYSLDSRDDASTREYGSARICIVVDCLHKAIEEAKTRRTWIEMQRMKMTV